MSSAGHGIVQYQNQYFLAYIGNANARATSKSILLYISYTDKNIKLNINDSNLIAMSLTSMAYRRIGTNQ